MDAGRRGGGTAQGEARPHTTLPFRSEPTPRRRRRRVSREAADVPSPEPKVRTTERMRRLANKARPPVHLRRPPDTTSSNAARVASYFRDDLKCARVSNPTDAAVRCARDRLKKQNLGTTLGSDGGPSSRGTGEGVLFAFRGVMRSFG